MVQSQFLIILVALAHVQCACGDLPPGVGTHEVQLNISGMDEHGKIRTAPLTLQSDRRLGSTDGTVVNELCVDYTVEGYFPSRGAALLGVPAGFATRPSTISPCELESLHRECVDRLNMYRSGQFKFSDGTSDSNVLAGLSPLKEETGNNQCSSHQTLGDHVRAEPSGYGCAGAHFTAFTCAGSGAQNSCCSWFKEPTYIGVKQRLFDCLQSMWDEGITPGQKGHWQTMRSPNYQYASCGFAWAEDGQLSMNQDFYSSMVSNQCSCKDKTAGASDGCGGTCVACAEPVVLPCQDADITNVFSRSCTGPATWSGSQYCTCPDIQRFSWCGFSSVSEYCPLACNNCPVFQPTCPSGPPQTTTVVETTSVTEAPATPVTTTSPGTPPPSQGLQSGDAIFLKSFSGSGNVVDVDGQLVRARWADRGNWQSIIIENGRGEGSVQSGDMVYLKTHTGAHIDVEFDAVKARWTDMGTWQGLRIEKPGGGEINENDIVCFKAHTGKHIDVQDGALRARYDDCGAWQAFRVEKEHAGAIRSGSQVQFLAHTGKRLDVEGNLVQCRWDEEGEWQKFVIENHGGRAIYSGDAVYLQAHTGNHIDVESEVAHARWHDRSDFQRFFIEKDGDGIIFPGDTVFLQAHTGKHIAVEGSEVTARWHDHGLWQSLIIEQPARRLQGTASTGVLAAEEMEAGAMIGFAFGLLLACLSIILVAVMCVSMKRKHGTKEARTFVMMSNGPLDMSRKVQPTTEKEDSQVVCSNSSQTHL